MSYYGDIRLGDTIDFKFCTTAAGTGAPTTLSSSPVISAYPSNSVTQLTAGITLSVDFDSVTGLNNVRVVASNGNGYATATNYACIITTGTVGGTSAVGYEVGSFSIENRSALMPTTAARTLVVDSAGLADANMVKAGPTGSGTAQTARDLGASVLISSGTGTGQLDVTSGVVKANATTVGDKTGYALTAAYDAAKTASQAGDAMALTSGERTTVAGVIGARQITEGYRSNGASPTNDQALSELLAHLGEATIAATTKTIKKFDHSTTAETFTLNDPTNPTSITRAT